MEVKIYPVEKLGKLNLHDLHQKINKWVEELDFLEDEIRFFNKVIRKYLSDVTEEFRNRIKQVEDHLYQFELNKHALRAKIISHREQIELLIKNLVTETEEENLKQRHILMEKEVDQLNKLAKIFKTELFKLTEDTIK